MDDIKLNERFIELQNKLLDYYGAKATSRFINTQNPRLRIHVLEAGKGTPILIFHGGDGEAVQWAPLIAKLQDKFHLLAVDRPGFGLSGAFDYQKVDLKKHASDFVGSLLDELKLEKAVLMGGSMGGFFALSGALAHPNRVERLILIGMPVGLAKSFPLPLRLICGIPGMSKFFMSGRRSMTNQRKQYEKMFKVDTSNIPDLFFETRIAGLNLPVEKNTWAVLLRRVGNLWGLRPEVNLSDELPNLQQPTLIIWGEHDMQPPELGRSASQRMKNAKFVVSEGTGHFPFLENTEVCAGLIEEFLGELHDKSRAAAQG